MARSDSLASRLYRGEVSYEFISRRRRWYAISGLVIIISLGSLGIRGLHGSIDFSGGAVFSFQQKGYSLADVRSAVASAGVSNAQVQLAGSGGNQTVQIQTPPLVVDSTRGIDQVARVEDALQKKLGITDRSQINSSTVGPSWGSDITHKALLGLIVFLVVVILYLSLRFEPKMAAAAFVALLHDLIITAGIYSLSGFEVSPSTIIALLTILGYSLYDTVVVFDKVRENTVGLAGGSRMTYSQAANLALNQTLVRSINTSIIALLPVVGLLVIGAGLLGAGSLKDLALALLVGLASGAYSSIFIATPLLTELKEHEPAFQQLARRVAARQAKETVTGAAMSAGPASAAPQPARAATATAVLERESDEPRRGDAAAAGAPARTPAGARPGRPPQRRGKGGRPGKKRRR